jgi:hypothetical protein
MLDKLWDLLMDVVRVREVYLDETDARYALITLVDAGDAEAARDALKGHVRKVEVLGHLHADVLEVRLA